MRLLPTSKSKRSTQTNSTTTTINNNVNSAATASLASSSFGDNDNDNNNANTPLAQSIVTYSPENPPPRPDITANLYPTVRIDRMLIDPPSSNVQSFALNAARHGDGDGYGFEREEGGEEAEGTTFHSKGSFPSSKRRGPTNKKKLLRSKIASSLRVLGGGRGGGGGGSSNNSSSKQQQQLQQQQQYNLYKSQQKNHQPRKDKYQGMEDVDDDYDDVDDVAMDGDDDSSRLQEVEEVIATVIGQNSHTYEGSPSSISGIKGKQPQQQEGGGDDNGDDSSSSNDDDDDEMDHRNSGPIDVDMLDCYSSNSKSPDGSPALQMKKELEDEGVQELGMITEAEYEAQSLQQERKGRDSEDGNDESDDGDSSHNDGEARTEKTAGTENDELEADRESETEEPDDEPGGNRDNNEDERNSPTGSVDAWSGSEPNFDQSFLIKDGGNESDTSSIGINRLLSSDDAERPTDKWIEQVDETSGTPEEKGEEEDNEEEDESDYYFPQDGSFPETTSQADQGGGVGQIPAGSRTESEGSETQSDYGPTTKCIGNSAEIFRTASTTLSHGSDFREDGERKEQDESGVFEPIQCSSGPEEYIKDRDEGGHSNKHEHLMAPQASPVDSAKRASPDVSLETSDTEAKIRQTPPSMATSSSTFSSHTSSFVLPGENTHVPPPPPPPEGPHEETSSSPRQHFLPSQPTPHPFFWRSHPSVTVTSYAQQYSLQQHEKVKQESPKSASHDRKNHDEIFIVNTPPPDLSLPSNQTTPSSSLVVVASEVESSDAADAKRDNDQVDRDIVRKALITSSSLHQSNVTNERVAGRPPLASGYKSSIPNLTSNDNVLSVPVTSTHHDDDRPDSPFTSTSASSWGVGSDSKLPAGAAVI